MKCPNCSETLSMTERQGVEIDYCPNCRGVWLDRGELDKIIEKSISPQASQQEAIQKNTYPRETYSNQHSNNYKDYERKRRKDSFLGDLFDF